LPIYCPAGRAAKTIFFTTRMTNLPDLGWGQGDYYTYCHEMLTFHDIAYQFSQKSRIRFTAAQLSSSTYSLAYSRIASSISDPRARATVAFRLLFDSS
jgi:hypothetical protein